MRVGRTRYIEARGYRVIRFWNNDVDHGLEGVIAVISSALAEMPQEIYGAQTRAAPTLTLPTRGREFWSE